MPTLSFKVSEREAARIRELARRERVTVSEFLRRRAVTNAVPGQGGEYRIVKDPLTGLPVMEGPAGMQPVTSDHVRALLANYP